MKNYAIILASGNGERTGLNIPKQYALISGKPVLEYSIETFQSNKNIDGIIIVYNPNFQDKTEEIIQNNNYTKVIKLIKGGKTRQESSYNGVFSIDEKNANVLIHDAARPFVSNEIINRCINALKTHKAVNTVIKSSDTVILVNDNNIITTVPDRNYVRRCQTPQCFDINLIKKAHNMSLNKQGFTDDCSLVLKNKLSKIYNVQGSNYNIKITYLEDIETAELILKNIRENYNYNSELSEK
mgnify:CR=1 FL=1